MADDLVELELMLNRFNRLINDILRGGIVGNVFQSWEIDLLIDMENCQIDRKRRRDLLRQYQRAVERQMEMGPGPPMKMSEFLEQRAKRKGGPESPPAQVA